MANHRPKSLSELNQVYDKAMQAQRAIKEGSQSLSHDAPATENPEQNIFDELTKQASQAKKPELYDSEIADIANDFLKRYAKPEQRKPQAAPKELKRPAPSIQSLYHTPVKPAQAENKDVPLNSQPSFTLPDSDLADKSTPAVKPKTPESIIAAATQQTIVFSADEPETQEEAVPFVSGAEETLEPEVQQTPAEAHPVTHEVAPSVRITSVERSDLINEYLRVMSDDDDGYYDDEEYAKPKKDSFWSRIKKRRHTAEPVQTEADDTQPDAEDDLITDVYSSYSDSEETLTDENSNVSAEEELPLSLYDYIESDFDYDDDEIAEESYVDVPEAETLSHQEEQEVQQEHVEAAEPDSSEEQEEGNPPEEAEEIQRDESDSANFDETPEEILTEETQEASQEQEEVVYPDEEENDIDSPEEVVVYPTEESEVRAEEAEEAVYEDSPTAGMVFDDIFSVSDESKRSYTGGNWNGEFEDSTADVSDNEEPDESFAEDEEDAALPTKKAAAPKKKKGGLASKIILSLLLVTLIVCTAFVSVLGSVVAVDTGKLFSDKYRAFTATQDFALSGVYAGDLVITEDYDHYAAEGDSFVYVNYETQKFMIGKHRGSTYNLTGDVLFIAENEAGRILVLREDTLGAITKTYKGLGSVLGGVSDNYIIIDAVLLLLILAVLLCLIIPKLKKGPKNVPHTEQESLASDTYAEEYSEEEPDEEAEADSEDESEKEFDPYDYDTDDLEEGLFSGI